ncbi:hypothetical protein HAX54_047739 [Datura stramonium]|uniref:Uncharacterized protein n=1 Tax=Datura stramonium TaxID=4076 RepID=A0ABS8STD3_DATST|nr:hypothetical protein [Datura stramonium]
MAVAERGVNNRTCCNLGITMQLFLSIGIGGHSTILLGGGLFSLVTDPAMIPGAVSRSKGLVPIEIPLGLIPRLMTKGESAWRKVKIGGSRKNSLMGYSEGSKGSSAQLPTPPEIALLEPSQDWPLVDTHHLSPLGRNPCDGSKVVSNILRIPREIDCCHCALVVKGARTALKYCSMSQRSSSLGISNPVEWLWFRDSSLESPGETFGSRTGNLSPQQAPQFDPVRHALDIATGIVEAP